MVRPLTRFSMGKLIEIFEKVRDQAVFWADGSDPQVKYEKIKNFLSDEVNKQKLLAPSREIKGRF